MRNFQHLLVEKEGQRLAGLRDPTLITRQMLVVSPPALQVVAQFDGSRSLAELSRSMSVPEGALAELARKLDEVGMLWGPTYDGIERALRDELRNAGRFPSPHAGQWGEDASTCRQRLESLLGEAEDPELAAPVAGLVVPHLDPERAAGAYASAYRAVVGRTAPHRVLVLGTNHFGAGDGVTTTRLGFDSPLGTVPSDGAFIDALEAKLGDRILKDELDHFGEHSIQLHVPWIAHLFPGVPMVALLVPDPTVPMLADDGARASAQELMGVLSGIVRSSEGETLVIASSDLSHVGMQFGDANPVDEARQDEVERHDREMLALYLEGSAERFVEAFAGHGNPTRWCSVGAMAAALLAARPRSVELIDYLMTIDPRRLGLVSCASMALLDPSP